MKKLYSIIGGVFIAMLVSSAFAQGSGAFPELEELKKILAQDESQLDLLKIKLTIDKLIDPAIDIESETKKVNVMVSEIKSMLSESASPMEIMLAIKKYLYAPGDWNHYQVFKYDFDDPLGTKISNKLLANYMRSRKGNCVTMPFLFIILGDKLGIDVAASVAPLHVFVKFKDTDGKVYNIETTSGANFARNEWYRQQMPMTDQAVEHGVYLKRLNRKETVAVMITTYAEHLFQEGEYKKSVGISSLSLQYYPEYVNAMLRIGSAYYRLLQQYFVRKYPNPKDIPQDQRELFYFLSNGNRYWFSKAESLGWREPPKYQEEKYLKTVKRDSMKGGM